MATHFVVIDTCFRRASVKLNPGMYLIDVLEEACRNFGVTSTAYSLKYNNKSLDLSQTVRQSGLVSGARLELVLSSRSPLPVSVALQLPTADKSTTSNARLVEKFSNDTTLWLILRKFESNAGLNANFTARGVTQQDTDRGLGRTSQMFYEMPVLNVMGREISTFVDFQKTLRNLGFIDGTCLIKLDFRKTNQPLEEAMRRIQEYFHVDEPAEFSKDETDGTHNDDSVTKNDQALFEKKKMASPPANLEEASKIGNTLSYSSETTTTSKYNSDQRPIAVYAPPNNQYPMAATIPYEEDDFEPTIAHAKLHQSRLLSSSQNKRLPSDSEIRQIDREKAAKLANISSISVKLRFPDQSTVVSSFGAKETGADIYKFTTSLLVDENKPFKLTWHNNKGPQMIPNNEKKLVSDLGLQTRMLINFSWNNHETETNRNSILKPEHVKDAKDIVVPIVPGTDMTKVLSSVEIKSDTNQKKKPKIIGKWFKGLTKG